MHQHGLLPQDADTSPSTEESLQESATLRGSEPEMPRTGRLLARERKSRYIDSTNWHNLGDDEMQRMSDDEDEDEVVDGVARIFVSDPLTGAFLASE